MSNLMAAVVWAARWEQKKETWQLFYGFTVGAPGRTVTQILADTESNRRLFTRGVL